MSAPKFSSFTGIPQAIMKIACWRAGTGQFHPCMKNKYEKKKIGEKTEKIEITIIGWAKVIVIFYSHCIMCIQSRILIWQHIPAP